MKIKAVLFDVDNTLIDFMTMKQESCKAAVHAMTNTGLQMTEKEAYEKLLNTYFALGLESDVAFTRFLENEKQFSHKIRAAAINAYLEEKTRFLQPYPNVETVLKKLQQRGLFLAIVTDAPKTKAYQRLLAMNIEAYFRFVVGYEDTNNTKASGLPFLLALENLRKELPGITNDEILMIGDSLERDIIPAKKLGLRTALSKYGEFKTQDSSADFNLEDISDILNIF
jgi:putative hydrolase of the HAD superfamily